MTLEERIEALEAELTQLRAKPPAHTHSAYRVANQNCKAYFEQTKAKQQHYGGLGACREMTRAAFREKHAVTGRNISPTQYIRTEEEGVEYFELFKAFLSVYQGYLQNFEKEERM